MEIRVLGCSGSIAQGSRTTSFLLGQHILFDAGTGVGDLSLDELACIDHIFISHSHLDHVLSIGLLADCVTRNRHARRLPPIKVHALPETLAALRQHIFNGVIWPDFTRLPEPGAPVLALSPIEVGQVLAIDAVRVEVLPAAHTVPAVGFAAWTDTGRPSSAWVYTGDTGPNPALWERLASLDVRSLVIETAFPDDELELARISRHLCPQRLHQEIAQLHRPTDVYITHIKPGELEAVMAEILARPTHHRVHPLATGSVIPFGD